MQMLEWLALWPGARILQDSGTAYLLVNAAHILGVGLLVGGILPLDLRLMGVLRSFPLAVAGPLLSRIAATGLGVALITGFWLFTVNPKEYAENPAFLSKLGLLALALGNIALQHRSAHFRAALAGHGVHARVRIVAGISALLWLSVLVAGRWIGFV